MTNKSEYPLEPMQNNLLIEKVDLVERTIVLNGVKDSENVAKVLSVGPGRTVGDKVIPVSVKPGDYVIVGGDFRRYRAGYLDFLIINENSIVAKITNLEKVLEEPPKKTNIKEPSMILKG